MDNHEKFRVPVFREKSGLVYVGIDGLRGWKSISEVKEILRKGIDRCIYPSRKEDE